MFGKGKQNGGLPLTTIVDLHYTVIRPMHQFYGGPEFVWSHIKSN